MKKLFCSLGLLCLTLPVSAEVESSLPETAIVDGFYIGAGAGFTSFWDGALSHNDDEIWSGEASSLESEHSSLRLYSGYHITRIVGVEVSYTNYGKLTANNDRVKGHLSPHALSIAANVGYTFDNGLRAFGLAGLSILDLGQTEDWLDNDAGVAFRYGFGGEYQPSMTMGLTFRLAYEADLYTSRINTSYGSNGDTDDYYISQIGSLYLGASYKF